MVQIKVLDDAAAIANAAAELFFERATAALEAGRDFSTAVSGGSTPGPAYAKIATLPLDWSRIHIWWVDERFVPPDDENSNEKLVREAWLNHVPIPYQNVHPMFQPGPIDKASVDYENAWTDAFGEGGVDLAFMGIGNDGHTASIFPGDTVSLDTHRLVLATKSPAGVSQRVSLTKLALSRCSELVFLVTGDAKSSYVKALADGSGSWPACQVARSARSALVLADRAAGVEI